jgi:hypothetical protein
LNYFHPLSAIDLQAFQTTSFELGMDKIALPILRIITAVENSDFSATVTLLKVQDLRLVLVRLPFINSLSKGYAREGRVQN